MNSALTLLQKDISCHRNTFAQPARSIIRNSCPQNLGTLPKKICSGAHFFGKLLGVGLQLYWKSLLKKHSSDDDVTPGITKNFPKIFWTTGNNWVMIFKNGPSKICGRQPLKNFTWSILNTLTQLLLKWSPTERKQCHKIHRTTFQRNCWVYIPFLSLVHYSITFFTTQRFW